jgi:putative ABC transport system substrate-binding protein
MNRREFVAIVGVVGLSTLSSTAHPQTRSIPVIGFVRNTSQNDSLHLVAAFRQGLKETGHEEDRTVKVEYRWAENRAEKLAALIEDLTRRRVSIVVAGGNEVAVAAKAMPNDVSIVFAVGADPQELGLVKNLNRPGGNITGVSFLTLGLTAKRLDLAHKLIPRARVIGLLVNPSSPIAAPQIAETQRAAKSLGIEVLVLNTRTEGDFVPAFEKLSQGRAHALLISGDKLYTARREQLVALAAKYRMPTIYAQPDFVPIGGLLGYGASINDAYRQVGVYVGRILKGAKPGDLPVIEPSKYDLAINLRTAKKLGLTVAQELLLRADSVVSE